MTSSETRQPHERADSSTPSAKKARRPWRTALIVVAAIVVLLPLLVAGLLLAGVQTEVGTRTLWSMAQRALPGKLSGTIGGSLSDGITLRDFRYHDATQTIAVDRVDAKWNLDLSPRKLTVDYLRIGTVDVRLQETAKEKEPATMPASLVLPLALDIQELAVNQIVLHQGESETKLSDLRLRAASDRVHHSVTLEQLDTPAGRASAALKLDGRSPFPTTGNAQLSGAFREEQYQVAGKFAGTLKVLGVDVVATARKLRADVKIQATPFADLPFERLQATANDLNPQVFVATAPQAELSVRADLVPRKSGDGPDASLAVAGPIRIDNAQPGAIDAGKLPLVSLAADVVLDAQRQTLSELAIRLLDDATISGSGTLERGDADKIAGEFAFDVRQLNLQAIHTALQPTRLKGPLTVKLTPGKGDALDTQKVALELADRLYRIKLGAEIDAKAVQIDTVELRAGEAGLNATGRLALDDSMAFEAKGALTDFNPAQWVGGGAPGDKPTKAKSPSGVNPVDARINLDFDVAGVVKPELQAKLAFGVHDSVYGDLPMTGGGTLQVAGMRLLPSDAQLTIAGNDVFIKGSFGTPRDKLDITVDAPQLARLGYGLSGALQLEAEATGTMTRPNVRARYKASDLVFGEQRVASLAGRADVEGAALDSPDALAKARLSATVDATGVRLPDIALDKLAADLSGTFGEHALTASANGKLRGKPLALNAALQGKLTRNASDYAWSGTLQRLENRGLPRFALADPMPVSVAPQKISTGAARLTIAGAVLQLEHFVFDHGRIATKGALDALKVATVFDLVRQFTGNAPPVRTDLVLDGTWDLSLSENGSGFAQIERRSGDMIAGTPRGDVRLGLNEFRLRTELKGLGITATAHAEASRIGTLTAQAQTMLQSQEGMVTLAPDALLEGSATVRVPELRTMAGLVGPQVALGGNLGMDLVAGGTVAEPKLSGDIEGNSLSVTLFDLGIRLTDGLVRIGLSENIVDLQKIRFKGGDGTLTADGKIQLGESNPELIANVVADKLQLFASPDRQLTLSGSAKAANVNDQVRVTGKFIVDRALFDLPKSNVPRLGDDVVILGPDGKPLNAVATSRDGLAEDAEEPTSGLVPVAEVTVDLGDDFRFRGAGADLLLAGTMQVESEPNTPLQATGTVRVVEGTYEVFGRELEIERGLVNFQGPISNPNINILAMRRNLEVESGVEITGFANQPRIKLVSEPNVGDEEKLSWLMFGHGTASAGTGQINAQSAALTFLANQGGSRIAKGIGLDEFSIGESESGLNEQQVVNLGKAISENFTVGYEQSLTNAASIAKLTWQLSQRWSVIARAGAINSLDTFFSTRFDRAFSGKDKKRADSLAADQASENSSGAR